MLSAEKLFEKFLMNKNKNESSTGFSGFPRVFWIANSVELLERAVYYGVYIVIYGKVVRYLDEKKVPAAPLKAELAEELN